MSVKSNVYTVDSLLERLALKGQQKVWLSFPENVEVKGTVEKVNNWQSKYSYISLEGSGLHLSLRCPYELRPTEGENIVFSGQVVLRPHKLNMSGLDVQIIGEPVGTWKEKHQAQNAPEINKGARILLSQYLSQSPVNELLITGSKTGLRDTQACFSKFRNSFPIKTEQIRVHDSLALLEDLDAALNKHEPFAFAVVRGGDDASLNIWDDPKLVAELVKFDTPFYLALGHSHRVTLADKYADETFHTPSNFGATLSQYYEAELDKQENLRKISSLQIQLASLNKNLEHERTEKRKTTTQQLRKF